jgi:hypothetical protein
MRRGRPLRLIAWDADVWGYRMDPADAEIILQRWPTVETARRHACGRTFAMADPDGYRVTVSLTVVAKRWLPGTREWTTLGTS